MPNCVELESTLFSLSSDFLACSSFVFMGLGVQPTGCYLSHLDFEVDQGNWTLKYVVLAAFLK